MMLHLHWTRAWVAAGLLCILACNKDDPETEIPNCLDMQIESFQSSGTACSSGASVSEYTFQNRTVYVFSPGNCGADLSSEVLDRECRLIGMLGGISGNSEVNGEDFGTADLVRVVWSN